jgi:5-formyltetrahydrofolate cyclo-ligase
VAFPDSRFDFDFSEFIADFRGSDDANLKLAELPCFKEAKVVFITPDNCLEKLRLLALQMGKSVLITTYAIRRGFWLLKPDLGSDASNLKYASTLDGMEKMAQQVSLSDIKRLGIKVDLMVTGTGAINTEGIRFGKGHGFFDLEWAMLYTIGAVKLETRTFAIVHDCQVLEEPLTAEEFDTVCDTVITPTRVIEVPEAKKPECGILWEKLAPGMFESIPPLQELKGMIEAGEVKQPQAWAFGN